MTLEQFNERLSKAILPHYSKQELNLFIRDENGTLKEVRHVSVDVHPQTGQRILVQETE